MTTTAQASQQNDDVGKAAAGFTAVGGQNIHPNIISADGSTDGTKAARPPVRNTNCATTTAGKPQNDYCTN